MSHRKLYGSIVSLSFFHHQGIDGFNNLVIVFSYMVVKFSDLMVPHLDYLQKDI